jgi:RNA polymerase sigma factor (sigma-70 family)
MDLVIASEEHLLRFLEEESLKALAHFRSKGCPLAQAEDLLNDISLDLLIKIRAGRPFLNSSDYVDFCRYTWAALRNQGLSWRRKVATSPNMADVEDLELSSAEPPLELWDFWLRFPDAVETAVLALNPKLRAVAMLNFCCPTEEVPTRSECARILGINEETVKKRLLRARSQLKELLKNEHEMWLEIQTH